MIHPLIATIGLRREELRFSQTALAEAAGTSQSHISDMLTGRISPTLGVLTRLCAVLDIQIVALVDGEPYAAMHPATVKVAENQRRLAGALQDMAGVLVDLAKVLEGER